MRLNVHMMWQRNSIRSFAGLVGFVLFLGTLTIGSFTLAEDEPVRGASRDSTAGMRLPPRTAGPEAASTSRKSSSSTGGGLWTTVISLAAIVGFLGLAAYWLRPYLGIARGLPIDALELLGRRNIEQKVAIHLVRCGGKVLIVGVSPDGARTLSEITDPAEVQRLVKACHAPREARSPASSGFDSRDVSGTSLSNGMEQSAPALSGLRSAASRPTAFQTEDARRG